MKSSDKIWSTGEGNGNPLQYSCLQNPMDSMKRQKGMIPEDESSRSEVAPNMPLENSRGQLLIAPERMKWLFQSRNNAQLYMFLVVEIKYDAVKNNTA